ESELVRPLQRDHVPRDPRGDPLPSGRERLGVPWLPRHVVDMEAGLAKQIDPFVPAEQEFTHLPLLRTPAPTGDPSHEFPVRDDDEGPTIVAKNSRDLPGSRRWIGKVLQGAEAGDV